MNPDQAANQAGAASATAIHPNAGTTTTSSSTGTTPKNPNNGEGPMEIETTDQHPQQQQQPPQQPPQQSYTVTLIAKWGKEKIELNDLPSSTSIGQIKDLLSEKTNVLPKRQKLIGLSTLSKAKVTDGVLLSDLKPKSKAMAKKGENGNPSSIKHNFILMGTAEKDIFVDPGDHGDLPDVVDDFDLDFNAGSSEWLAHVATGQNLKKFTESTAVNIMHAPREGKPLMVLDLDHTLLDFSRKSIEQASTADAIAESSTAATNNNSNNNNASGDDDGKRNGIYGDVFVGRAIDDEAGDVWERVDITPEEVDGDRLSSLEWCKTARRKGGGGGQGGAAASLSKALQNFKNHQRQGSGGAAEAAPIANDASDTDHKNTSENGNNDNGNDSLFSWTQTDDEVELKFVVPKETRAKNVRVFFGRKSLKASLVAIDCDNYENGLLCDGQTWDQIDVDGSTFTLQDEPSAKPTGRELCISMEKQSPGQTWNYAIES
mmetsp:Transcript_3339/g.7608  ORF Transcript_3339/g.7608 Transcript_3339/m.7608 type:complete len:488 (-) Transcript_3339:54-1517(-)